MPQAARLLPAILLAACGSGDRVVPRADPGVQLPPATAHGAATPPAADAPAGPAFAGTGARPRIPDPRERRFANLRQLTFEGENAEAYWSFDGTRLCFQHRGEGVEADQIYVMGADGRGLRRVSTGAGRTTCSFFLPGDGSVLFASTHAADAEPPQPPDRSRGYVWPVYPTYDLFAADLDGGNLRRLTDAPGYDAEAVLSPDGSRVVFTSTRDGDLDLYTMNPDGTDVRRVTREEGYDGGAFFSPDGKRLVYRAHHPKDPAALEEYRDLLRRSLVRPTTMEIFVCDADGGNRRQLTSNGRANFAPYFHPDGRRVLFASNVADPRGREFDLYLVGDDGGEPERVTFAEGFDGFPMFSPDGRTLAFCSNRHGERPGDTNVFLADWID